MIVRIPEIHPITDLVRDPRALVERVREREEPIVITQRGRAAAVLVPVEVSRTMESKLAPRIASPRLVQPRDAEKFRMELTIVEPRRETQDAGG